MKRDIVAIIWHDAVAFDNEDLGPNNFCLAPNFQVGLLISEDKEKIRIAHGYSLDHEIAPEYDFIVIPKSLIIYRKTLGILDTDKREVL